MLTSGNVRRGPGPTLVGLVAAGLLQAGPLETTVQAHAGRPDPAGVVAAYLRLAHWVRAFDPPKPASPEAGLPIDGAHAVYIQLRHRGRVVGRGVDGGGDALMVRRAAGRALAEVLGNPTVAGLPPEDRTRVGAALTIELEVAGPPTALPGRSFERIRDQLDPGLDGVALRRGDSIRWLFPARQRALGAAGSAERHLPALAVELGLPARELGELTRRFDVRVYRFRTIHLVQRGPGRRPFETVRGQVVVPAASVDRKSIAILAEGLGDHLLSSLWVGDEPLGIMGDYHPQRNKYDPLIASPRDQALAAFALARAATAPGLEAVSERFAGAASVILQELAAVASGEDDPLADPVACAAIVYAVTGNPDAQAAPVVSALFRAAAGTVARATDPERAEGSPAPPQRTPHDLAMIAGAAARLAAAGDDGPVSAAAARLAIDGAWASAPERDRVTLLPWIAWAEADLARATRRSIRARDELRAMRRALALSRVGSVLVPGPVDLHGGLAVGSGPRPRPTAQTARLAVFLASALRDPVLTLPEEAPADREHLRHTMRFLIQLSVDDSFLWSMPSPQRALGGIRAAAWDDTQPVAAQAVALLAAAETLWSLDHMDRAGRALPVAPVAEPDQKVPPESPPAE